MDQFEQKLSRFRPAKAETLKQQILKQAARNQPDSLTLLTAFLLKYFISVRRKTERKIKHCKYQAKTILISGIAGFLLGVFCVCRLSHSPDRLPLEAAAESARQQSVSMALVPPLLSDESLSKLESPMDWIRLIRQYSHETAQENQLDNNFHQHILLNTRRFDL